MNSLAGFINEDLCYSYVLYKRQKLLLHLIDLISSKNIQSRIYTIKMIFLLKQKLGFEKISYDFYPYKHGPFSNIVYKDMNYLINRGLLNTDESSLTEQGKSFIKKGGFYSEVESEAKNILAKFNTVDKIKDFVYENYPDYTVKSASPRKTIANGKGICSIGYEGKSIDSFLNQLIQNNINILVDVRNNPFSMKREFCGDKLKEKLGNCGIDYMHLPDLGIESQKRKDLESPDDFRKLFDRYAKSLSSKQETISKIRELGQKQKIALMCFEADKNFCHRGVLSDHLACGVEHL